MTTAMVVPETTPRTPAVLTPWANWDDKIRFADQMRQTGFLPSAIKTGAQALAIILTGQELGVPPMQSLRSINVIQGKPAMAAELQLALFKQRGGRAVWKRSDAEVAELWLRHPNGDEHTETFTIEDAKRANLTGKDSWRMYPKAMLRARCISAGLRAVAPDLIAGTYTAEELGADVDAEGNIVSLPPTVVEVKAVEAPAVVTGIDYLAAEMEPETGRQEVPVNGQDWAPINDWVEAMRKAQTIKALQHLWKGVTAPDLWETWSEEGQAQLTAEKDAAKARLSA